MRGVRADGPRGEGGGPIPAGSNRLLELLHVPPWCRGNIAWLLAGRALRSFSQAFLVIIVPLYVAAAGYGVREFGLLLSFATLGSAIFVLFIGFTADRYGRKRVLLGLGVLATLGAMAYAVTTTFWILALAGALASIGRGGGAGSGGAWGPFYPAEQAILAGSVEAKSRNSVFGAVSFVGVLAGAAGSAIAGIATLLHVHAGFSLLAAYRALFWLAVVAGAALVIVTIPVHEEAGERRAGMRLSRKTMKLLGKLWVTNGLNGLVWGVLGPFLTYWFYRRYGVGAAELGTFYTLANLVAAFPYLGAAALARRLGAVNTVVFTRVVSVGFLVAMTFAPTFPIAALCYLLRMVSGTLGIPVRQSFVMGVSDARDRSTVAALSNLPSQLTAAAAPSIGAYLFEAVSFEAPLLMAAAVQLINAATYYGVFRNTRPPEEADRARAGPVTGPARDGPTAGTDGASRLHTPGGGGGS